MSKVKRFITGVVLAALAVTILMPGAVNVNAAEVSEAEAKAAVPGISIEAKDNKVPVYKAGEAQKWTFVIKNNTSDEVKDITVAPDLGEDTAAWPFKTEYQNYQCKIDALVAGGSQEVSFDLVQREDVETARYTIPFSVCVGAEEMTAKKFYVNTTAKPQPQQPPAKDDGQTGAAGDGGGAIDAGGFSNGGASYSGGSGSTSVPRVIVTGFSTDPAEVRAGSDFTLTIHLKNTSKSTKVKNMLFDLTAPTEGNDEQTMAPAFLPTSGSSSIYLDGIKANGTADISIRLNAKADLLQKPYSVDLSMKYEDADGAQIDATSGISIPVKQDARFELSEFEISPASMEVGEEANVMCNLYNLGRIKLYNVKARFEGSCIEKEEIFIGNIESGATGSIDAMLTGKKATAGPAKVTMTLSYEDESGNISEMQKELQIEVMEAVEESMEAMEMPEEKSGFPILPIVILLIVAAGIATVVIVVKKKKKKQMLNEEEELLYELDGPSEDERQ